SPSGAEILLMRDAEGHDLRRRERVGEVAMEVSREPGADQVLVGGAHVWIVHRYARSARHELAGQREGRRVARVVGVGTVRDAEQGDRATRDRAREALDERDDLRGRLVVDPTRLEDEAVRRIRAALERAP